MRRRLRPIHRIRFAWKTRHWNRKHFPGCDVRYGWGTVCTIPELCELTDGTDQ